MINQIILVGNLTKEPTLQTSQSGVSYCRISVAWNIWDASTKTNVPNYITAVCFGPNAEFIGKNAIKGSKVCINGHLVQVVWQKDGVPHTSYQIKADNVDLMASNKNQPNEEIGSCVNQNVTDEDLPF